MREQTQASNAAQAADAAANANAAAQAAAKAASNAAQSVQGAAAPPPATSDLAQLSYNQLRRRLEELRNQRADIASRRQNLAESYETATGANREGMGQRLQMLDNNIVIYEAEIAAVGREMAAKAPSRVTESTAPPPGGYREEDIAGAVFGTFLTTALVLGFFMRRFFRRKYGRMPSPSQPNLIASSERLDRIEQAVDTIAVEIERVSENQRFMTRLMTETQLGSTIADVRKSAELAKSAAAEG
jgi:hypothetical protein